MLVKYRNELKFVINTLEYQELRNVLRTIMIPDPNVGEDGEYNIRSLYLDDMYRTAYNEKLDGVEIRKKYRIRIYNCSDQVISLECKHKRGPYIYKESVKLTREEYERMLHCDYGFLLKKDSQIAKEFFVDARTKQIRPWVIVEYDREPYIDKVGTVRITFDKNLRASAPEEDMFSASAPSFSIMQPGEMILEVKYTGVLPEKIRRIFQNYSFTQTSASKFCLCADKLTSILR